MPSTPSPILDGVFRLDHDGPTLLGSRCPGCGAHYFPVSAYCRNPTCDGVPTETGLSRRGVLYSFTVQRYQPPALFRMDPWKPYGIALVDLPEGLRVMGMLTSETTEQAHVGMPVELVALPIAPDGQSGQVVTYAFKASDGVTP